MPKKFPYFFWKGFENCTFWAQFVPKRLLQRPLPKKMGKFWGMRQQYNRVVLIWRVWKFKKLHLLSQFGSPIAAYSKKIPPYKKIRESFWAWANTIGICLFWFEGFENFEKCTFLAQFGLTIAASSRKTNSMTPSKNIRETFWACPNHAWAKVN